jgi:hypothetical protein
VNTIEPHSRHVVARAIENNACRLLPDSTDLTRAVRELCMCWCATEMATTIGGVARVVGGGIGALPFGLPSVSSSLVLQSAIVASSPASSPASPAPPQV